MSLTRKRDFLDPFRFHGVELIAGSSSQFMGDCPFCTKHNHFYVNEKNGLWDCKSCGRTGNVNTFLSQLHDTFLESTTSKDYKDVSEQRKGIPADSFREFGLAHSGGRWYIPYPNGKGLLNLRVWDGPGNHILNTTSCPAGLFNGHALEESTRKAAKKSKQELVYVCEGEWDAIAFNALRKKVKEPGIVVAVPGADVFKKEWCHAFANRHVVFLYDNDGAGQRGQKKAADAIKEVAASISLIEWPSNTANKYDLNDYVADNLKTARVAWKNLHKMLKPVAGNAPEALAESSKKAVPKFGPISFQKLVKEYKARVHIDKNMEHALAVIIATVLSSESKGDPLWLLVVGPPGSGKTLVLRNAGENSERCLFESNLSPHALVSGFQLPDGSDPSLLKKLPGKCLVIKDLTNLRSLPQTAQEEVYGTLRDIFDGRHEKAFGNNVHRHYDDCFFSIAAGVTDVIHGDNRTALGERFIRWEFVREDHDPTAHVRAAISGMDKQIETEQYLRSLTAAFIDQRSTKKPKYKLPKWVVDRVVYLSQIVGYLRAGVSPQRDGGLASRPRAEVATRVGKQLCKLASYLCVVFDKKNVDHHIYSLVEQCAFDTAFGWSQDLVRVLMKHYPKPLLRADLQLEARIHRATLARKLEDLVNLGIVIQERSDVNSTKMIEVDPAEQTRLRGQPPLTYRVSKRIAELWKKAKVSL